MRGGQLVVPSCRNASSSNRGSLINNLRTAITKINVTFFAVHEVKKELFAIFRILFRYSCKVSLLHSRCTLHLKAYSQV